MSDVTKKDPIDAPPITVPFRTTGYAGYTSVQPAQAVTAPRPEGQRTDSCRFRPAGC